MPLKPKTVIRRSEPTGLVCIDRRHRLSMPAGSEAGTRVYFSHTRFTGDLCELSLFTISGKPRRLNGGRLISARIRRGGFVPRSKWREDESFAIVGAPKTRLPSRRPFAMPSRSNHFVSLAWLHRRLQRSWL